MSTSSTLANARLSISRSNTMATTTNTKQTPIMASLHTTSSPSSTSSTPPIHSSNPSHLTSSTSQTAAFQFPRTHSFPPFYTLQPTSSTLHAQLQKWSSIILSYCAYYKLTKLSLSDALNTDLFWNKAINRRLDGKGAREVVEFMRKEGRAEWIGGGTKGAGDGGKAVCWIWWRSVEEWGELIENWVEETGQKNTVLTLYELTQSDATISQDFHGINPELLQRALNILVKRGKAQIFGQEDQQGVKFF